MYFKVIMAAILLSLLSPLMADDGLITKPSAHTVDATVQRLKNIFDKKGVRLFAHVDHQNSAAGVQLKLNKLQLLIFGNPRLGTPLMQSNPTAGIDLPMKALVWEDTKGKVWLAYNDPAYLAQRHGISDRQGVIKKMSGALNKMTSVATAP
ncbi:MAG: DUF302 domain-containing protein [Pseudomonadota bacterium]